MDHTEVSDRRVGSAKVSGYMLHSYNGKLPTIH